MTAAKRKAIAIMAAVLVILASVASSVNAGERTTRHNRQQPVSRITRAPDAPTSITHRRYSSPSAVSTPIPLAEVPAKQDGRAGRSRR